VQGSREFCRIQVHRERALLLQTKCLDIQVKEVIEMSSDRIFTKAVLGKLSIFVTVALLLLIPDPQLASYS